MNNEILNYLSNHDINALWDIDVIPDVPGYKIYRHNDILCYERKYVKNNLSMAEVVQHRRLQDHFTIKVNINDNIFLQVVKSLDLTTRCKTWFNHGHQQGLHYVYNFYIAYPDDLKNKLDDMNYNNPDIQMGDYLIEKYNLKPGAEVLLHLDHINGMYYLIDPRINKPAEVGFIEGNILKSRLEYDIIAYHAYQSALKRKVKVVEVKSSFDSPVKWE